MVVATLAYTELVLWQQALFCVFVALWWGYEYCLFQRRGRLRVIQYESNKLLILQYAHGFAVQGPLSPSSFANRWFIYCRVGNTIHILFKDALYPEDYRRLTVNIMWCR